MNSMHEVLIHDEKARELVISTMRWSGRPYSAAEEIEALRRYVWETHGVDVEIFT